MAEAPDTGLESTQVVQAAWAFYLLLAVGGIVWIGIREETIPLSLFFDPSAWWVDVAAGALTAFVLIAVWRYGMRRLAVARRLESRLGDVLGPLTGEQAVSLAIFSGIAEEIFFRGAVQGSWGWAWATILFALLHTGRGASLGLWTLFAGVAGGLFGGLVVWRGNLLAPIVAHFLVNAVNLTQLGAGRSADDTDGDDTDGGGADGSDH
jgi:hypothetical protein